MPLSRPLSLPTPNYRARIGELESKVIDDALLKRLQSDQREAIKLLGKLDTTMLIHAAGQQATITADQLASFENALESTPV